VELWSDIDRLAAWRMSLDGFTLVRVSGDRGFGIGESESKPCGFMRRDMALSSALSAKILLQSVTENRYFACQQELLDVTIVDVRDPHKSCRFSSLRPFDVGSKELEKGPGFESLPLRQPFTVRTLTTRCTISVTESGFLAAERVFTVWS
jgi:hypothetical protein